jgi:hypothetical protein
MQRLLPRLLLGLPVALFLCSVTAAVASYFVTCRVGRWGIAVDPNPPLGPRTFSSLASVESGGGVLVVSRTVRIERGAGSPPGSGMNMDFGSPSDIQAPPWPVVFRKADWGEGSEWIVAVRHGLLVLLTAAVALPAFIAWRRRRARGRTGPGGFPALSPAGRQPEAKTS